MEWGCRAATLRPTAFIRVPRRLVRNVGCGVPPPDDANVG